MIRSLVCLSLVVALASCGIRDNELTDADGNAVSAPGNIPPNPDWDGNIPDEISDLYELGDSYLYISPGGYMAKFRPSEAGNNCFVEFERQALFHDGENNYTSIDANPAPGETAQTHSYILTISALSNNGLGVTEIVTGGSRASTYLRAIGMTIQDVPICR